MPIRLTTGLFLPLESARSDMGEEAERRRTVPVIAVSGVVGGKNGSLQRRGKGMSGLHVYAHMSERT